MRFYCPLHGVPLSGGPVLYDCDFGIGHTVHGADLDREFHAPQAVTS